jgi:hypothetical protein
MKAESARMAGHTDRRRARRSPIASSIVLISTLAAVLAPKCPLCVAAYLSVFGVSVGAASVALPLLRPIAVTLAVLALASIVVRRRTVSACHPT